MKNGHLKAAPTGVRHQRQSRRSRGAETDTSLVNAAVLRAQAGDRAALRFLYIRYGNEVLACVKTIVKDHHEAEDITQNVFIKLLLGIRKYEARCVPFAAWIMRVARNAALDHLRSQRTTPLEDVHVGADHGHVSHELRGDLRRALDQLPKEQRNVLILRHIVGLSPVEIARMLGKTEGSIHGLHHRGRASLCSALEDLGATPVVLAS